MMGSWICYITYIDHYKVTSDEDSVRSTFCTGPAIRNLKNNFFSEFIGTFVLVFGVLFIAIPNIEIDGLEVSVLDYTLEALPVGIYLGNWFEFRGTTATQLIQHVIWT